MITDSHWESSDRSRERDSWLAAVAAFICLGPILVLAMLVGDALGHGALRYLYTIVADMAIMTPGTVAIIVVTNRRNRTREEELRAMSIRLSEAVQNAEQEADRGRTQASRQEFESRLANALDMAEGEPEVIDVIERSLATVLERGRSELLLADNSHAHLVRMASVNMDDANGCSVDSPDRCPAARRAQIQTFSDSRALDACPKLRQRPEGEMSAICVPVSIMGRTVGVIHSTGDAGVTPGDDQTHDLATLAKLSGARIGLLRVMAETQLQAATDNLTGLLNRRSFERKVTDVRAARSTVAIAMVDLDRFKELNDTYGHETGDRALRLFARVLGDCLRAEDLICRYGGEEFAIVFPACTANDARRALEAVRTRLDAAVTVGGLPKVTASFGVTDIDPHEDLSASLRRADEALFQAKSEGRDRVVVHASVAPDPAV